MEQTTATIRFDGREFECPIGSNLRTVLVRNNVMLYIEGARILNCRGLGTCGTCAVEVRGNLSVMTRIEQTRMNLPPLKGHYHLRLACQATVQGDLVVAKHAGFWGEKERTGGPLQSR